MDINRNSVIGKESKSRPFPIYRLLGNPDNIQYFDPMSVQHDVEELECRFVFMDLGTLSRFPNLRVLNLSNVTSLGEGLQEYSQFFLLKRLSLSLEPRAGESFEDGGARLINQASALLPFDSEGLKLEFVHLQFQGKIVLEWDRSKGELESRYLREQGPIISQLLKDHPGKIQRIRMTHSSIPLSLIERYLSALRQLEFSSNEESPEALESILIRCTSLEALSIQTPTQPFDVSLLHSPSLRSVQISYTDILSRDGTGRIFLEELNIHCCELDGSALRMGVEFGKLTLTCVDPLQGYQILSALVLEGQDHSSRLRTIWIRRFDRARLLPDPNFEDVNRFLALLHVPISCSNFNLDLDSVTSTWTLTRLLDD
jgi:hypothetical protein